MSQSKGHKNFIHKSSEHLRIPSENGSKGS